MFYNEETHLILLKCSNCKSKLQDASILPCGKFCDNCVSELAKETNKVTKEFQCNPCKEKHTLPDNGSKDWAEFYSNELKLERISRGDSAERLKQNLKEIPRHIDELNFRLFNGADLIEENCLKLRNEVMLHTELMIKQVQDLRDEFITEINEHQLNSISNLETGIIKIVKFNKFLNELRSFH